MRPNDWIPWFGIYSQIGRGLHNPTGRVALSNKNHFALA